MCSGSAWVKMKSIPKALLRCPKPKPQKLSIKIISFRVTEAAIIRLLLDLIDSPSHLVVPRNLRYLISQFYQTFPALLVASDR